MTEQLQWPTLFTRTQYGDCDLNFFLSSLPGLVDLTNFFIEILDKHENNYKVDYQRLKDLVEIPFCESINEMENTINYIIFVFFNSDFW